MSSRFFTTKHPERNRSGCFCSTLLVVLVAVLVGVVIVVIVVAVVVLVIVVVHESGLLSFVLLWVYCVRGKGKLCKKFRELFYDRHRLRKRKRKEAS